METEDKGLPTAVSCALLIFAVFQPLVRCLGAEQSALSPRGAAAACWADGGLFGYTCSLQEPGQKLGEEYFCN